MKSYLGEWVNEVVEVKGASLMLGRHFMQGTRSTGCRRHMKLANKQTSSPQGHG